MTGLFVVFSCRVELTKGLCLGETLVNCSQREQAEGGRLTVSF